MLHRLCKEGRVVISPFVLFCEVQSSVLSLSRDFIAGLWLSVPGKCSYVFQNESSQYDFTGVTYMPSHNVCDSAKWRPDYLY